MDGDYIAPDGTVRPPDGTQWYNILDTIKDQHMPPIDVDRMPTAGEYRRTIAGFKQAIAAHPEWGNPPWGDLIFGCLGQGIRDWLRVAPDDEELQHQFVNRFDRDEWESDRIRKGLPVRQHDGTFVPVPWQHTVQEILDAHLLEPRRRRTAGMVRVAITEIAAVVAAHPGWGDPDWKKVVIGKLGQGTWDWLQVAADGDVMKD